jgi:Tol biopolymer transport system component
MAFASRSAVGTCFSAVVVSAMALFFGGCASPVPVTTTPAGATAYINGKTVGTTPTQVTLDGNKPVDVEFQLNGYFPEQFTYTPGGASPQITARLEPRSLEKKFDITSTPEGASLALDGAAAGATPQAGFAVTFTRDDKNEPWKPRRLVVSKQDYQSESVTLTAGSAPVQRIDLALLREEKVYTITAANSDGAELNAEVTLNGAPAGKTPLRLPIVYQRPNKQAPWPKFNLSVEIPAKYKPVQQTLEYRGATKLALKLEAVTEIPTKRTHASVVMTPTGAELQAVTTSALAMLNTHEPGEIVSSLKPVTSLVRQDVADAASSRVESVNSFCVTPDGQNVVFSQTERDEQGALYSNLYIKRADDSSGGISRLTSGTRYWDFAPYIANDGSNYLVFSSNRGDRRKLDIFRVNLVDNRLSGGISRLTSDGRFNYAPTYGDSNRQLFYLSVEADFPKAEPQINSIRIDGSLPTQMSLTALEINNAYAERVYYVKRDPDTKNRQLFSITPDGKLETALINQEDFRHSNCFNPAVSPDGSKVLFVSDHGTDEQGRNNNDIYIINSDGSGLMRLTQNGSDDVLPAWSPSEDGVIFFLSNRGGAYNVWRMKLVGNVK